MALTPKNFRTFNPWGHVSKADRLNRLRICQEIVDRFNGKTWRVWERPVGPDDERLRNLFTWYEPHQWKSVFHHLFASEEEAADKLFAYIGGGGIEQTNNEYRKYGMRYIIEEEKEAK